MGDKMEISAYILKISRKGPIFKASNERLRRISIVANFFPQISNA